MPRMDGLTVLERIRAGQSAAPRRQAVIVHSAGLAPGEEARFRSLGVRALLDKPVPPAMLLAALRDVSRGCPGGGRQEPLLPCGAEEDAPVIWDKGGRAGGRGSGRGAAAYPGHGPAGRSAASGRGAGRCPENGRRSCGPGGADGGGPAPGGPCPEEFRGHALPWGIASSGGGPGTGGPAGAGGHAGQRGGTGASGGGLCAALARAGDALRREKE